MLYLRLASPAIAASLLLTFATHATAQTSPLAWTELGGSSSGIGAGISNHEKLWNMVLDSEGRPIVAYIDYKPGAFDVFVIRWNGRSWVDLGTYPFPLQGISGTGGAYDTAIAVNGSGQVIVAWTDRVDGAGGSGPKDIMVRRWNGLQWETLGGSASPGGISQSQADSISPSVAIDEDGNPWVAWQEGNGNPDGKIYVRGWNGSAWVELDGSATGDGLSPPGPNKSRNPEIRLSGSGQPSVAWCEWTGDLEGRQGGSTPIDDILFKRWTGSSWEGLAGSDSEGGLTANTAERSTEPSLALQADGNPVIAWRQSGGGVLVGAPSSTAIYLRRWNGSEWAQVGGSGSGGGINNLSGSCGEPKLSVDASGNPIVAWRQTTSTNATYLRRWNGSGWVGLGGSDSGGGISGASSFPLFVDVNSREDIFVAWSESSTWNLYIRVWHDARVSALTQHDGTGLQSLAEGATNVDGTITFKGATSRTGPASLLQLQVEIQPVGVPFGGIPMAVGSPTPAGQVAIAMLANIAPGSWRWRARVIDDLGVVSTWLEYGSGPQTGIDFIIPVPPPPPSLSGTNEGGSSGGNGCGLLGIEGPLMLIVFGFISRRRLRER